MHRTVLTAVLACAIALAAIPAANAQANTSAWRGQDNEFGSIRAPYTTEIDGKRATVEAKVTLRKYYEEKDGRFYMFAFSVEHTPMDVTFDNLVRADTGKEINCHKREGSSKEAIKCFVDLRDMPPVGTDIIMRGTVGSSKVGSFQMGAIVVPFTYAWFRVPMTNGLDGELYAGTTVNVMKAGGGSGSLAGLGNKVPGVGVLGLALAGGAAAALVTLRRRA